MIGLIDLSIVPGGSLDLITEDSVALLRFLLSVITFFQVIQYF